MRATQTDQPRGVRATYQIRLRSDIFDRRTSEMRVYSEVERASLVKIDRTMLLRFRKGQSSPSLEVAWRMADALGLRVEDLFERVPAGRR